MFNQAENYFPALDQWRPPRVPRPKIIDGRRERTWSEHEIKVVLGELFAPKREDEQVQSAIARYKVGRKVQFCLLNGVRHSEMNLIPKTGINWEARQVRIRQGKTLQSHRSARANFYGDSSRVLRRVENRPRVLT